MVGSVLFSRLVPSLVLFSFLLLIPAGATGQESVASWLDELGLDRLRIHALQQRLDVSSIDEEERERVTDQLLALYGTLLAEQTDEVFLEELNELSGLILDRISTERGDPIRLDLYTSEWRSLITRSLNEIVLGRAAPAENRQLIDSMLDLSVRVDALLKRANSRSRKANQDLREAQGSQVEQRTRSFDELEDVLRKVRSLSGWVHAYLGWFKDETSHSNTAQRMFASLLSSDGSPFVVPNDNEISVQRRSEDWYAELIIGMAIAQAPEASNATVGAWLDLVAIPTAAESARLQVPFYRLALLLSSDESDRYADSIRILEKLGPEASSECLRIVCLHALDDAADDPDAAALVPVLLRRLIDRGGIQDVVGLARGYSLDSLPEDRALGHFMRGCQWVLEARRLEEVGELQPAVEAATAALQELDAALAFESDESDTALSGQLLLLRATMNELLERPLPASLDFEAAAGFAEGTKAADLLWNSIALLRPGSPGVPQDQAILQRRRLLIDRLLAEHPTHPRAQAARLLQMEQARQYTLEDAEQLLQPANDPATAALAVRKAAAILYREWVNAPRPQREALARRFVSVVSQPEILRPDGAIDSRDLGLLLDLLRLSMQLNEPDLDLARQVLSTLDSAIDSGTLSLNDRELEYESLRVEALLADESPDFAGLQQRFESLRNHPEDPFVRRAALLLVIAARDGIQVRPSGSWTPSEEAASEIIRAGVPLLVGTEPTAVLLQDSNAWQLVRTLARAEHDAYEVREDREALLRSFTLYQLLVEARPLDKSALEGLARTALAAGRDAEALESWRVLMNAASEATPEFFESKVHFLEVLARSDPERVRLILEQHVVFYPDYGPPPWGVRLRTLHERVGRTRGGTP